MFTYRRTCRACDHDRLVKVFDLGLMPLSNDFHPFDGPCAGYAPLVVNFCERCTLAQLSIVVDPLVLYRQYNYETSKSETMRLHFRSLWDAIQEQCRVESVIEIGSNDGEFLAFVKENGADSVLGIDAAENLAGIAQRRGITTVIGILDNDTAAIAARTVPKADVIVARHVFCHVDDWRGFMRNVDAMANKDTLVVIEVPYAVDTLERGEFDQFYHEHLSYLSIKAMTALLESTPFRIQKVMRFPIHGGAIAVFIRRRDCELEADQSVQEFLNNENITVEDWRAFSRTSNTRMEWLAQNVNTWRQQGKKVAGYGASAKSTVWISACGFMRKEIAFIVDNTPHKQGKFSPGTDIPILPESAMTDASADMAICFAWNFMDFIVAKNKAWVDGGGQFINPHEP